MSGPPGLDWDSRRRIRVQLAREGEAPRLTQASAHPRRLPSRSGVHLSPPPGTRHAWNECSGTFTSLLRHDAWRLSTLSARSGANLMLQSRTRCRDVGPIPGGFTKCLMGYQPEVRP